MKRKLSVLLAVSLFLLLPACEKDAVQISGPVAELQTGEDGALAGFVVRTREGKQVGVLLHEGTSAFPTGTGPWTNAEMRLEFQEDLQIDVKVSASCAPEKKSLTRADGTQITAYEAAYIRITGRMNRGAATLRDGTVIDVLENNYSPAGHTYMLPAGTELLQAEGPSGPENCYVGGLESFDDLSETAKEKISAWYEAQGVLYDEAEELERAYASWKEKGADFRAYRVDQNTSPSASGERVMYFCTSLILPLDHGDDCTGYEVALGAAFDRETGERLELWDLFQCPEAEAQQAVIDAALDWNGSGSVRQEMTAAFTPERVVVGQERLSMNYEPGSMPSQEHSYYFSADIGAVSDLMYGWAAPKAQN